MPVIPCCSKRRAWTSTWRSSEPTVSLYASTAPSSDRPSFDDVRAHRREPLVELAAELAHLARALGDRLLLPASCATVRRRIDQRARRGEDDVRAPRVLLERRVVLVRHAQVRLVREEHDDEVGRRLELAPVRPSPRASPTCSRTWRAWSARRRCALCLVGRLEGVEVGRRAAPSRRRRRACRRGCGRRGRAGAFRRRSTSVACVDVVAVLDHSGVLDDVAQLRSRPSARARAECEARS